MIETDLRATWKRTNAPDARQAHAVLTAIDGSDVTQFKFLTVERKTSPQKDACIENPCGLRIMVLRSSERSISRGSIGDLYHKLSPE